MNIVHICHRKLSQSLNTVDCFERVIYRDGKVIEMMDIRKKNIFVLVCLALRWWWAWGY